MTLKEIIEGLKRLGIYRATMYESSGFEHKIKIVVGSSKSKLKTTLFAYEFFPARLYWSVVIDKTIIKNRKKGSYEHRIVSEKEMGCINL